MFMSALVNFKSLNFHHWQILRGYFIVLHKPIPLVADSLCCHVKSDESNQLTTVALQSLPTFYLLQKTLMVCTGATAAAGFVSHLLKKQILESFVLMC